jgi:plastocyanin/uncharacterized membrane protein YozB (DUF420 family)
MLKDKGFLGTGATFGADLNLLLYVLLLVPLMLIGFRYARRKQFRQHKYVMTVVTLSNWVLIALIMAVSYYDNVRPGIPDRLGNLFFLSPTVHAVIASTAQLLATYLVIRMWFEKWLPKVLLVKNFKPWMRLVLGLWLVTAALGIVTYSRWYLVDHKTVGPQSSADGLSQLVPLQGFAFNPKALTVMVGTTVTWVNHDTVAHTVTFDDGSVSSGSLLEGDTFSHTFDVTGSYGIYCKFHGGPGGIGMSMTVTVVDSLEQVPTPAPSGPTSAATAMGPMVMGTPEAPAATQAAPAASGSVAVTMQDYAFNPDAITIKVGTTITWTNHDSEGHTVTSDDGRIDSGNIDTNQTYSYTFDTPGTYPIYCRYHGGPGGQGMHMMVTVVN